MDWKIPATILILAFVVVLGVLPIFSPDFNKNIASRFTDIGSGSGSLFQKAPEFKENVEFSMSVNEFPVIKTLTPVKVYINESQRYAVGVDGKNLSLKGSLILNDFTGEVNLKDGKIEGIALGLESDGFKMEGKSNIEIEEQGLDQVKAAGLMIADFSANNGVLKTTKPQKMEAKLDSAAKVYGFQGSMEYKKGTCEIQGTATMIKANGLTIGVEETN